MHVSVAKDSAVGWEIQVLRQSVAGKLKPYIVTGLLILIGIGCVSASWPAEPTPDPIVERFKRDFGTSVAQYDRFFTARVNGRLFLFAYWVDGSPVNLMVDIFDVNNLESASKVYKWYRGSVSEEVIGFLTTDVDGDGREELVFVSLSGQIKLVRILRDTGRELVKIFDSGASDVILYRDGRRFKMVLKNSSAGNVEVYGWSKAAGKLAVERQYKLLY
jgi:hypothetical protein